MRKLLYHLWLRFFFIFKHAAVYKKIFFKITTPPFDVWLTVHGKRALLPATYHYPIVCRRYSSFNNPYLQLVYEVFQVLKRPLFIVDVGAAVGDGYLLITQNIPQAVEEIICIEGSEYFLKYLHRNILSKNAIIINDIVSDRPGSIPSLKMMHPSTASLQGERIKKATTLDAIWEKYKLAKIDILKIDVDGYDGNVIGGATKLLQLYKPFLIFEFHPLLIKATGNDYFSAFEYLHSNDYQQLFWFDKYGVFSHYTAVNDKQSIDYYYNYCLSEGVEMDWHYDIIAVSPVQPLANESLITCSFANHKQYPY